MAVPAGTTTALAHITVEEAVRLWRLAGAANSPRRLLLGYDDLLLRTFAVVDFSSWRHPLPRFEIGPDGRAGVTQSEVDR